MPANPLVGTWRLVRYTATGPDGQVFYPFGEDAAGYLMYTDDEQVSVNVMKSNRPITTAPDITVASVEEKAAFAEGYLSYSGTYDIRGNRVFHHPKVALFPNWIGVSHERLFEIKDNVLTLSAPMAFLGSEYIVCLVWERG